MPISCSVAGIDGHSSAPRAGGAVRSLPVAWTAKEALASWEHWSSWALCADTWDWGHRGFSYWLWTWALWLFESEHAPLWADTVLTTGRYTRSWTWLRKCRPVLGHLCLEQMRALPTSRLPPYGNSCLKSWGHFSPPQLTTGRGNLESHRWATT